MVCPGRSLYEHFMFSHDVVVIKAGYPILLETALPETASRSAFGRLGILDPDQSLAPSQSLCSISLYITYI